MDLLAADDAFLRSLAKHLLVYALGRGTVPADEDDLDGDGWLVCEGAVRTRVEIEDLVSAAPPAGYSAALSIRLAPDASARCSR